MAVLNVAVMGFPSSLVMSAGSSVRRNGKADEAGPVGGQSPTPRAAPALFSLVTAETHRGSTPAQLANEPKPGCPPESLTRAAKDEGLSPRANSFLIIAIDRSNARAPASRGRRFDGRATPPATPGTRILPQSGRYGIRWTAICPPERRVRPAFAARPPPLHPDRGPHRPPARDRSHARATATARRTALPGGGGGRSAGERAPSRTDTVRAMVPRLWCRTRGPPRGGEIPVGAPRPALGEFPGPLRRRRCASEESRRPSSRPAFLSGELRDGTPHRVRPLPPPIGAPRRTISALSIERVLPHAEPPSARLFACRSGASPSSRGTGNDPPRRERP